MPVVQIKGYPKLIHVEDKDMEEFKQFANRNLSKLEKGMEINEILGGEKVAPGEKLIVENFGKALVDALQQNSEAITGLKSKGLRPSRIKIGNIKRRSDSRIESAEVEVKEWADTSDQGPDTESIN